MRILFNFASRSRPEQFFSAVDNLISMCVNHNYSILAKIDIDDRSMNNVEVAKMIQGRGIQTALGNSRNKIHAINRDIPEGWDMLINWSDDMKVHFQGFDAILRSCMPNMLDTFLHVHDDYAKGDVCTVSIMGRNYYQRDNYVYHPDYYSLWCDNEATEVAKRRGRYVHVPDFTFEHLHYTNMGKSKYDELYRRNNTYNQDHEVYKQREAINFGL